MAAAAGSELLRTPHRAKLSLCTAVSIATLVLIIGIGLVANSMQGDVQPAEVQAVSSSVGFSNATLEVYLGNGCFWERQWAYFNVETNKTGPFSRNAVDFTAYAGYAGGEDPPAGRGTSVCYHTGDARDYAHLGSAEAVRVTLDRKHSEAQMAALARNFFDSFTGGHGSRQRPDPMDRGSPYRSFAGFPGGMHSPLFTTFAKENTFGMRLKEGRGGDGDVYNTVWIYDTEEYPFYRGEVYHQNHCNFFPSEGMPYPDSYTDELYKRMRATGKFIPTGCPENPFSHSTCGGRGGLLG